MKALTIEKHKLTKPILQQKVKWKHLETKTINIFRAYYVDREIL